MLKKFDAIIDIVLEWIMRLIAIIIFVVACVVFGHMLILLAFH